MDMSGSSSGNVSAMPTPMPMTFTTSHSTPLYSTAWTPRSEGAYAGNCIFLIVLGLIFRLISAYRQTLERRWHERALNRRYIVVAGETEEEREKQLGLNARKANAYEGTLTVRGMDERVRVMKSSRQAVQTQAWRLSTDLPRA